MRTRAAFTPLCASGGSEQVARPLQLLLFSSLKSLPVPLPHVSGAVFLPPVRHREGFRGAAIAGMPCSMLVCFRKLRPNSIHQMERKDCKREEASSGDNLKPTDPLKSSRDATRKVIKLDICPSSSPEMGFLCPSSEEDLDSHCFLQSSLPFHTLARGELLYESSLGKNRLFQAETGKENPHFWIKRRSYVIQHPSLGIPQGVSLIYWVPRRLFVPLTVPGIQKLTSDGSKQTCSFFLYSMSPIRFPSCSSSLPEASISTLANSLAFLGIYILRLVSCPHLHWFLGPVWAGSKGVITTVGSP